MSPEEIQKLLTANRQETQKRFANEASTEAGLRSTLFGDDPALATLRKQEGDQIKQLFEHDKNVAAQYQTPPEEGMVFDPYIRELQLSNRYAGTMDTLTGIRDKKEQRKDVLGNMVDKAMKVFMAGINALKEEGGELNKDLDRALDFQRDERDFNRKTTEEDDAKKTKTKEDTSDLWDKLYAQATTERDIWNMINENQDAWGNAGIDVRELWSLHKDLVDRVGKGGKISGGQAGQTKTTQDVISLIPAADSRKEALFSFKNNEEDMKKAGIDTQRVRAAIEEYWPLSDAELEEERIKEEERKREEQPGGTNIISQALGSGAVGFNPQNPGIGKGAGPFSMENLLELLRGGK